MFASLTSRPDLLLDLVPSHIPIRVDIVKRRDTSWECGGALIRKIPCPGVGDIELETVLGTRRPRCGRREETINRSACTCTGRCCLPVLKGLLDKYESFNLSVP